MAKRLTAVIFIGIFLALNIEATMVSFFVIETGLSRNGVMSQQHSQQWENAFLDEFFNAGFIVSNTPILRLDSKPSARMEDFAIRDLDIAREGGADFLIVAQLDYIDDSPLPGEISLFLFRVTPVRIIHERRMPGKTYRSDREEFDDLKTIVRGLIPFLRAR